MGRRFKIRRAAIQPKGASQRQEIIQARQLAATPHEPLTLKATDSVDLKVLSALAQDALIPAFNFHYDANDKTFTILANRFCWEESPETLNHHKIYGRILCSLYFQHVEKVQHIDFDPKKTNEDYNLLALDYTQEGEIQLIFSGTTRMKLKVSDLCCHLTDLEDMWYTTSKPDHEKATDQYKRNVA